MTDELDNLIREIAVKHGTSIGKDDPILMLHTLNKQLIEDNKKAQQELLITFKSEIEQCSAKWKENAHEKAEKILNASLTSSKEMMSKLVQHSSEQACISLQNLMTNNLKELKEIRASTKIYSITAFLVSGIMTLLLIVFTFFKIL